MTTTQRDEIAIGMAIVWLTIGPAGEEEWSTGRVWSPAPAVGGVGRAWWVLEPLPGAPEAPEGPVRLVLVAYASRRHQVGRQDPRRGFWAPRGGRVIERGSLYRESDPRSRIGRRERATVAPQRVISGRPANAVAEVDMILFARCVAAGDLVAPTRSALDADVTRRG